MYRLFDILLVLVVAGMKKMTCRPPILMYDMICIGDGDRVKLFRNVGHPFSPIQKFLLKCFNDVFLLEWGFSS